MRAPPESGAGCGKLRPLGGGAQAVRPTGFCFSQGTGLNKILMQIAAELKVRPAQVNAAVNLLDGGATVPFIARYRKEATEGLDDIQLRELEARRAHPIWTRFFCRSRPS